MTPRRSPERDAPAANDNAGALVVTLTVAALEAIVRRAVEAAIGSGERRLVDKPGLAKALMCSAGHIDALRKRGLPTVMIGQAVRFDVEAVVAWLETTQKGSGSAG